MKTIATLFMIIATLAVGAQNYTTIGYDEITNEVVKIPKYHPNDVLRAQGLKIGDTPYLDINGTRQYFTPAHWEKIVRAIETETDKIINREKNRSANQTIAEANATINKTNERIKNQRMRDKADAKDAELDNLGPRENPK